jgi:hypothetical protein
MTKLAAAAKLYDTKFAELESQGFSENDAWAGALAAVRAVFPSVTVTRSEGWVYELATA